MSDPYRVPDPPLVPMITFLERFKLKLQTSLYARNILGLAVIVTGLCLFEGLGRLAFAISPLTNNNGVPCAPIVNTIVAPFAGVVVALVAGFFGFALYKSIKLPAIVGKMIVDLIEDFT